MASVSVGIEQGSGNESEPSQDRSVSRAHLCCQVRSKGILPVAIISFSMTCIPGVK